MAAALTLARRGLGGVWPNPSVGCVLVGKAGQVVGRGWTQPGGRPHGETEALGRAGELARDATAYISLEPCNHWGKTPPCSEALVNAGISRAVIALEDPDPRVSGSGIARLRAAGIAADVGLCAEAAAELNAGFLLRLRSGRPIVALKVASTLDGRIATATGESQWITGEAARRRAHALRSQYDAIMVGTRTALRDDPMLTCRLPGLEQRSPVRVVFDGRLQLPLTSQLAATAHKFPTWLICRSDADPVRAAAFADIGVQLVRTEPDDSGRPEIGFALRQLGSLGLTRVLVEGGGMLAAALLRAELIDRLIWFHAPLLIGGDGVPAIAGFGLDRLGGAPRFERQSMEEVGGDVLETYARRD